MRVRSSASNLRAASTRLRRVDYRSGMTVCASIQIADFQMSAIPSVTGTSRLIYVVAMYPWLRADKVSSSTVSNGPRLCMFIFQTFTSSRGQYKCSRILQVATRRQVCSGTKFGIESFWSFWMRMHNSHRAAEIHARSMSKSELTQIVLQGSQLPDRVLPQFPTMPDKELCLHY